MVMACAVPEQQVEGFDVRALGLFLVKARTQLNSLNLERACPIGMQCA